MHRQPAHSAIESRVSLFCMWGHLLQIQDGAGWTVGPLFGQRKTRYLRRYTNRIRF